MDSDDDFDAFLSSAAARAGPVPITDGAPAPAAVGFDDFADFGDFAAAPAPAPAAEDPPAGAFADFGGFAAAPVTSPPAPGSTTVFPGSEAGMEGSRFAGWAGPDAVPPPALAGGSTSTPQHGDPSPRRAGSSLPSLGDAPDAPPAASPLPLTCDRPSFSPTDAAADGSDSVSSCRGSSVPAPDAVATPVAGGGGAAHVSPAVPVPQADAFADFGDFAAAPSPAAATGAVSAESCVASSAAAASPLPGTGAEDERGAFNRAVGSPGADVRGSASTESCRGSPVPCASPAAGGARLTMAALPPPPAPSTSTESMRASPVPELATPEAGACSAEGDRQPSPIVPVPMLPAGDGLVAFPGDSEAGALEASTRSCRNSSVPAEGGVPSLSEGSCRGSGSPVPPAADEASAFESFGDFAAPAPAPPSNDSDAGSPAPPSGPGDAPAAGDEDAPDADPAAAPFECDTEQPRFAVGVVHGFGKYCVPAPSEVAGEALSESDAGRVLSPSEAGGVPGGPPDMAEDAPPVCLPAFECSVEQPRFEVGVARGYGKYCVPAASTAAPEDATTVRSPSVAEDEVDDGANAEAPAQAPASPSALGDASAPQPEFAVGIVKGLGRYCVEAASPVTVEPGSPVPAGTDPGGASMREGESFVYDEQTNPEEGCGTVLSSSGMPSELPDQPAFRVGVLTGFGKYCVAAASTAVAEEAASSAAELGVAEEEEEDGSASGAAAAADAEDGPVMEQPVFDVGHVKGFGRYCVEAVSPVVVEQGESEADLHEVASTAAAPAKGDDGASASCAALTAYESSAAGDGGAPAAVEQPEFKVGEVAGLGRYCVEAASPAAAEPPSTPAQPPSEDGGAPSVPRGAGSPWRALQEARLVPAAGALGDCGSGAAAAHGKIVKTRVLQGEGAASPAGDAGSPEGSAAGDGAGGGCASPPPSAMLGTGLVSICRNAAEDGHGAAKAPTAAKPSRCPVAQSLTPIDDGEAFAGAGKEGSCGPVRLPAPHEEDVAPHHAHPAIPPSTGFSPYAPPPPAREPPGPSAVPPPAATGWAQCSGGPRMPSQGSLESEGQSPLAPPPPPRPPKDQPQFNVGVVEGWGRYCVEAASPAGADVGGASTRDSVLTGDEGDGDDDDDDASCRRSPRPPSPFVVEDTFAAGAASPVVAEAAPSGTSHSPLQDGGAFAAPAPPGAASPSDDGDGFGGFAAAAVGPSVVPDPLPAAPAGTDGLLELVSAPPGAVYAQAVEREAVGAAFFGAAMATAGGGGGAAVDLQALAQLPAARVGAGAGGGAAAGAAAEDAYREVGMKKVEPASPRVAAGAAEADPLEDFDDLYAAPPVVAGAVRAPPAVPAAGLEAPYGGAAHEEYLLALCSAFASQSMGGIAQPTHAGLFGTGAP